MIFILTTAKIMKCFPFEHCTSSSNVMFVLGKGQKPSTDQGPSSQLLTRSLLADHRHQEPLVVATGVGCDGRRQRFPVLLAIHILDVLEVNLKHHRNNG